MSYVDDDDMLSDVCLHGVPYDEECDICEAELDAEEGDPDFGDDDDVEYGDDDDSEEEGAEEGNEGEDEEDDEPNDGEDDDD